MIRLLIGFCLVLVLTLPALAAPGDPRFLQGTVEWPAALTGEPVIIVRGDDGRVYSADVSGARRHGSDVLKVGGRVALLVLEGARPHDVTAIVIGAGDAASLARALSQGGTPTPAAAAAPPNVAPPAPPVAVSVTTPAPAPAPVTPAPVAAPPATQPAATSPVPPAATSATGAAPPTPPAAAAAAVTTPAPASAPAAVGTPPAPAPAVPTAPPPPTGPIPVAPSAPAPSVATPVAATPSTVIVTPPPSATAPPPAPPAPAAAPAVAPTPSAPTKVNGGPAERKQWARVDGKVQSVEGALLVLKADNGSLVMVDISQLNPNVSQSLRRGRLVSVYGYPLEQKFEAAGYIELDPSHPEPPRLRWGR